jgi:hypothetical protein
MIYIIKIHISAVKIISTIDLQIIKLEEKKMEIEVNIFEMSFENIFIVITIIYIFQKLIMFITIALFTLLLS